MALLDYQMFDRKSICSIAIVFNLGRRSNVLKIVNTVLDRLLLYE